MKFVKRILKSLGPGFITGASDDDPSGIATYAQTGAIFGYAQLWLALFAFPFMTVIQEMCGRIGMVTGKGLAGVIRKHYSHKLLYSAMGFLMIANTINIGADLGAMASAVQLVIGGRFIVILLLITVFTLVLEVFVTYDVYARILKYFALTLLAYIITAFVVKGDWKTAGLSMIMPHISFDRDYIINIVAILGTTISPYLFFWQAGEEVEEEVSKGKIVAMGKGVPKVTKREIFSMRIDTAIGMFFSQIVMFFIIFTTAATLSAHGVKNIQSATQAAEALRPLAGNAAYLLFGLGIVGTGLLAVPVLAGSASYALSETFGWKEGLYRRFSQAHGFYGVITVATVVGLIVNFLPVSPFQMLYYTAVLNGVMAPPLMIVIMLISNNQKIMGKHTNSKSSNIIGWIVTGVMSAAAIILLVTSFF
jgi:NRAMP (natural resistance-associated macrophage protein)-like metal ion transporter